MGLRAAQVLGNSFGWLLGGLSERCGRLRQNNNTSRCGFENCAADLRRQSRIGVARAIVGQSANYTLAVFKFCAPKTNKITRHAKQRSSLRPARAARAHLLLVHRAPLRSNTIRAAVCVHRQRLSEQLSLRTTALAVAKRPGSVEPDSGSFPAAPFATAPTIGACSLAHKVAGARSGGAVRF